MLKPTQDKQLLEELTAKIYADFHTWKESSYYDLSKTNQESWQEYGKSYLSLIEKQGYHKGLPPSIEEALNSGDGVYRP